MSSRVVSPQDVGYPGMSRSRRYTVMFLKAAVDVFADMWKTFDDVAAVMRGQFAVKIPDLFLASLDEITEEILPFCKGVGVSVQHALVTVAGRFTNME